MDNRYPRCHCLHTPARRRARVPGQELPASSKRAKSSTFDLLDELSIPSRLPQGAGMFQHSLGTKDSRELDWRMWTTLPHAEPGAWLHYPLCQTRTSDGQPGLVLGIALLCRVLGEASSAPRFPVASRISACAEAKGVVLRPGALARFLSVTPASSFGFTRGGPLVPVGAALARTVLDCFRLRIATSRQPRPVFGRSSLAHHTVADRQPGQASRYGDASGARTRR